MRMIMRKIAQHISDQFSSLRFALELIAVILIKATLIVLIWKCFFSHPIEQGLTQQTYQDHFFGKAHQGSRQ